MQRGWRMVLMLLRLHDARGKRRNVPRDSAALYGAGDDVRQRC